MSNKTSAEIVNQFNVYEKQGGNHVKVASISGNYNEFFWKFLNEIPADWNLEFFTCFY